MAPYYALCEETIAELAGAEPNLVKKWVDDLSSLLDRDEWTNGGFVLGIYQFPISLSAMTVPATIESTPRTRICSWQLLASRRWFPNSSSIFAGSKTPGLLMRTLKTSRSESQRISPTLCNTVLFTGRITFVLIPTIVIGRCGKA